jgi:ribonucleotide reductase beta subunit family protein with ferritin-like domain
MFEIKGTALRATNFLINAMGGRIFQVAEGDEYRRVHRLYENAKRDQWNASVHFPGNDALDGGSLTPLEREAICRVFSQLYYGERGAQVISSQLCSMIDDSEAANFLSTQAMDEARHVEIFASMLARAGKIYPMNPFLNALLTDMMRCDKLEEKLVGMNLLVEGLALSVFKFTLKLFDREPRYKSELGELIYDAIKLILKDESRHVGFGVVYLPGRLRAMSRRRRAELQARLVAWMGLLFGSVRYHKRESAIVGIPYMDILSDILADHQARVNEMGVGHIITGERLSLLIPTVDRILDRVTGYEDPMSGVAA